MSWLEELENKINKLMQTENGDVTYKSTLSANLDLFVWSELKTQYDLAINKILKAYGENKKLFIANLLNKMDIRQGKGMRKQTQLLLEFLVKHQNNHILKKILEYIGQLGRYSFYFDIMNFALQYKNKEVFNFYLENIKIEAQKNKLIYKWMPTIYRHGKKDILAKLIAKYLFKDNSEKQYRLMLKKERAELKIIEPLLSSKQKINAKQFGKFATKSVFNRLNKLLNNDLYKDDLKQAIIKGYINKYSNLNYNEIVHLALNNEISSRQLLEQIVNNSFAKIKINNLPKRIISIVDVSGSMGHGYYKNDPLNSAIGFGLVIANQSKGIFHNKFLTFHSEPELVSLPSDNFFENLIIMKNANWGMNTNIDKVFEILLKTTIDNDEKAPEFLMIFSDMQFDMAINNNFNQTFIERWKNKYQQANLQLPKIIFWNLNNSYGAPVIKNELNTILMTGLNGNELETMFDFSYKQQKEKQQITPLENMLFNLKRYELIVDKIFEK